MTAELSSTQTIAEMATLGKMLHEHRPALLAMLERRIDPRLAHRLHAEDLLSEAFLEARRKWTWFKQQTGWSSYLWLYRICMDCLIAAWRRESREKRDVRREMPLPEHSSICMGLGLVQSETSPSHGVAREELRVRMREVIALLRPADQEILWLRHADQLSFADLAMLLDVTENAATVRYVRALRKLKDLWLKLYPQTSEA